jgi:hypothetical protein
MAVVIVVGLGQELVGGAEFLDQLGLFASLCLTLVGDGLCQSGRSGGQANQQRPRANSADPIPSHDRLSANGETPLS